MRGSDIVKVSLYDDKSFIFFNKTLSDLLFLFNNKYYFSVIDCYNNNKIINMWRPDTIPRQQKINMIPDYFLINDDGYCFSRGNLNNRAFDSCVKAYLFCKYYEQVSDFLGIENVCRYYTAYNACKLLWNSVDIDIERLLLQDYNTTINDECIVLNVSKDVCDFKLDMVREVHINLKSLNRFKNPKLWLSSNSDCKFNIYLETMEDKCSYLAFFCSELNNVVLHEEKINTLDNKKIISIGSLGDIGEVNWNNLLIIDGD